MAKSTKQTKGRTKNDVMRKATWDSNADFMIKGHELHALAALSEAFSPLVNIPNRLIRQAENEGTVRYQYTYTDGASVPIHIVKEFEDTRKAEVEKNKQMLKSFYEGIQEKAEEETSKLSSKESLKTTTNKSPVKSEKEDAITESSK